MKRSLRLSIVGACALAALLASGSCSRKQSPKTATPEYYADSILAKARELTGRGYELLDAKDLAGATAKFAEAGRLMPGVLYQEYNTACAHARLGDKEEAFRRLTGIVENGMDMPEALEGDPDFKALQEDPRMKDLVDRARANFEKGTAHLASGLPEFAQAPDTFTSVASLEAWKKERDRARGRHREIWTASQFLSEQAAAAGRYLADLRALKSGDSSFDYGLERVRASMRLQSPYSPGWGAVSDLILREAGSYLKGSPAAAGADEANYSAGTALSLKCTKDDARCAETFKQAEIYLSKIADGSEFFPGAQALMVVNAYASPDADRSGFGRALRAVVERFPGDERVHRVLSTRLENGAAAVLWPIEIGAADLDGRKVSLADYRGKALMIDFWATWCSPCRAELPGLVKAYAEYHPRGFEIVSISLDLPDRLTKAAYRDSVAALGMTWRHMYDEKGWDTELVKRFFVGSIPAPFLVGRDGSIVAWGEDLRGAKLAGSIEKALGTNP
jgi:thiol-disulfide isomerase/thioredoxin